MTINFYDVVGKSRKPAIQLVQSMVDQIKKFGRLIIVPCPIQPGHYYLKNYFVDETQLPLYRLLTATDEVMVEVIATQEILAKRLSVLNVQGFFMCKSNWP
jgi:Protein of unknown function (DUF1091)